ncbi:MAG: TatD family hydrolase [Patescibacteria group bacterium]
MMVDTHAHCHFSAYKGDQNEVIKRSLEKGTVINLIGTQRFTSRRAVEVAEKYTGVYAGVGLHPEHLFSQYLDDEETTFITREDFFDYEYYKRLATNPKVVGIGECGLDFYRIPEGMSVEKMLPKQSEIFLQQIKLAKEFGLPLIIHCRDAHEQMLDILKKETGITGTMHCYTSNWANAEQYLNLGLYIGFTGVITFPPRKSDPKAQEDLLEVVRRMPSDRILLETDCPYLSPIPFRGQRGEPWMIGATAAKIAELRGISLDEVLKITTENALRLFTKMKSF